MSVIGDMISGSAPGVKFEQIGDTVSGVIVEIDSRQDCEFQKPEKLKWWNRDPGPATGDPADRPVMVPIFTIQIDEDRRDSAEDDGRRAVWARGNLFSAIRDAIKKAYRGRKVTDDDLIGATLKAKLTGRGKATKGNPPKLFAALIEPRSAMDTGGPDPFAEPGQVAAREPAPAAQPRQVAPARAEPQYTEANPPPVDTDW